MALIMSEEKEEVVEISEDFRGRISTSDGDTQSPESDAIEIAEDFADRIRRNEGPNWGGSHRYGIGQDQGVRPEETDENFPRRVTKGAPRRVRRRW